MPMVETSHSVKLRRLGANIVIAGALLALVLTSAQQNKSLTDSRLAGDAGIAPQITEPPAALSFIVVGLGAFRGLAAEVLWFRADQLQLDGRYFELVQLASWITALDPYAAEAWAYNAWNLSYNISALMLRHEDRARWVFHGISLVRDEALLWNPGSAQLCRELAWLYLHKVSDNLDDAAPLYRRRLSEEIAPLLGADGAYPSTGDVPDALSLNWRLDPERVATLIADIGPLDWRQSESHALYWALEGVRRADSAAESFKCRRTACHALMALYERRQRHDLLPALLHQLGQLRQENPSPATIRLHGIYLLKALRLAKTAGNNTECERLYALLLKSVAENYIIPPLPEVLKLAAPEYLLSPQPAKGMP